MSSITRSTRGNPWMYRGLIWNFARRDLKARFRGTFLGWLWSLMLPLATLLIYSAVFSIIFRAVPPPFGNGEPGIYVIWLLVGIVTYSFFGNGVTLAMPSLLSAGNLLQKIYIPSYVPVMGTAIAASTQSLVEYGILLVVLIVVGNVGLTWLLFPFLLLMFFIFTLSVSIILSVLNVYARDLQQITGVVIQLLFFLSPILYPLDQVPEEWNGIPIRAVMAANPVAEYIVAFRNLLYDLALPSGKNMLALTAWTVGAALLAWFVYLRKGQDIGEAV
ncbi:MAG: ABC transporter permease [Actinobacteria bacterium]|nr:ABC transporter permease [Actinomycetota bacterium]MCB9411308.1 ABC transporter permease [Actinomycetota bacterium]